MTDAYVADVKKAAKENNYYRDEVFTASKSQLVLMSLRPGEDIGTEVHDGDQIIYVVDGDGYVVLDGQRQEIDKGSIVFVPAGVRHNVVNGDHDAMKLFTIYAPAQHAPGTVQLEKEPHAAAR
jgi:mannose-6-phosphate isomerase-like protein (cupin superfamily)